ncbi:signal recognition particle protein [Blastocystis sp. ATCC 50177/Nand II]|uniref:Signal recognition particle protein n=1 Tax=Blastocystis sp. subtype 1 (strain ATCC 50177 / NandII) TaxID=478820 RepID=A0A196S9G3_BLAHN|nr:signal recognition particle protein [Blastocystis sp. ATCC 50177/Nand II]
MFASLLVAGCKRASALSLRLPSALAQSSPSFVPQRSFGVFSSIKENLANRAEEKKQKTMDEGFKEMLQKLASYDTFSMKEYKEVFIWLSEKSGANGWKSHIPGVGKMEEVKEMKKYVSILNAMTPLQLAKPQTIKSPDRQKLAQDTKLTVEYVNKVLRMYDQQLVMYKWVHMRKQNSKPIPTTVAEMKDMMSRDHSGITMKDMMKLNPQQSRYQSTRQKIRM